MKKIKTLLSVMVLLLPLMTQSQNKITPIRIGDPVPDITLKHIINYPQSQVKIADFKNKLIIIDFFATWCGTCIEHFPGLDSLYRKHTSDIQIFAVTHEDFQIVDTFFHSNIRVKGVTFPIVTQDTTLKKLFPHRMVPHVVWIKNGKVLAITEGYYVNEDYINKVLRGGFTHLAMKKDEMTYNSNLPLLENGNGGGDSLFKGKVVLSKTIAGLGGGTRHFYNKDSTMLRTTYLNKDLLTLYSIATRREIAHSNRIILDVKTDSAFVIRTDPYSKNIQDKEQIKYWYHKYGYCLELTLPVKYSEDQRNSILLSSLNLFSGYTGTIEKRKIACWVIQNKKTNRTLHRLTQSAQYNYRHSLITPLNDLIARLQDKITPFYPFPPIILNETSYQGHIELNRPITKSIQDIPVLRAALEKVGLKLLRTHRSLTVLVISKAL